MKLTELFLAELEREHAPTRRALERVPDGRYDWKPHEKSMSMGNLSVLVASIAGWMEMMINLDQLDIAPKDGPKYKPAELRTSAELVRACDEAFDKARKALKATTDQHLMTHWKMLAGGKVVSEQPRHVAIRDGVLMHLAHHRGQLTVYLRLTGAMVPSVYGPTADDRSF
jgi:uncharacterized damage-inducible protein DinB